MAHGLKFISCAVSHRAVKVCKARLHKDHYAYQEPRHMPNTMRYTQVKFCILFSWRSSKQSAPKERDQWPIVTQKSHGRLHGGGRVRGHATATPEPRTGAAESRSGPVTAPLVTGQPSRWQGSPGQSVSDSDTRSLRLPRESSRSDRDHRGDTYRPAAYPQWARRNEHSPARVVIRRE